MNGLGTRTVASWFLQPNEPDTFGEGNETRMLKQKQVVVVKRNQIGLIDQIGMLNRKTVLACRLHRNELDPHTMQAAQ